VALVVPHKRAILLEGRDGNGLVLQHPQIIGMSGLGFWHQLVYATPQTLRKAILILKTLDQLLPDWHSSPSSLRLQTPGVHLCTPHIH